MPAVLVEAGFINSDTDNELFDSNFQDIAQAIATGILDTLENAGVLKEPETPVEQTKYRTGRPWISGIYRSMETILQGDFRRI